jgi:hypothetical protein
VLKLASWCIPTVEYTLVSSPPSVILPYPFFPTLHYSNSFQYISLRLIFRHVMRCDIVDSQRMGNL